MFYYSNKRFNKDGFGVTQPCQIRYIKYFQHLLLHKKIELRTYYINKIQLEGNNNFKKWYGVLKYAKNK